MSTARAVALLLTGALIGVARAAAQQPLGSVASRDAVWPLPRLEGEIRVDGRSDDPAWQAVAPLPMTVYLPTYGAKPTERTEARVAYDSDAIYVVVDAWEAHPGGVRASSMIRDDDSPGDFLNVLLDTFGDRQNAVTFSTTPGGQRNDWSISNDAPNDASLSPAWNGVWDLAVRRGPDGWHAEFRIPFTTLRFTTRNGRAELGFSLNRLTAHSNERVTFPAIEPSAPLALWKPSRWQRVSIENITDDRSLRVMPYVMAGSEGSRAPDPVLSPWHRDQRFEAGGDLKTALSPNLTLDLTVNTDFAEAEVDDQRINLTRFPLFFPERRAFFVERAGTFEVKTGEVDLLFNSRRVGLTPDGDPVRLLGGTRLVGRVLDWDLGLLDVQTGRTPGGARENLGVLRARRALWNQRSWAGLMLTSRVTPDSGQLALGADGELYLGGDNYVGFALAALVGDAGVGPDDGVLPRGALRLLAERRRNRGMWYRGGVATTGARYAPALGYVERGDAIQPLAELGYGWVVSPAGHQLRASLASAFAYRNAAGEFDGSTASAILEFEPPSGALWTLTVTRQEDDLLEPFTPVPDASVPAGRYTAGFAELKLKPSTGPRAVLGGSVRAGEYYDGQLYSVVLSPEWRASAHLRISADVELDRLVFAARDERVWSPLARLKVLASASPRLSFSAVLQANGTADLATANLRLRYSVSEGHDLWVVYNHDQNLDRDRWWPDTRIPGTARSGLLVKYTRSFGR
jgi:hypothetical protein